MKRITVEDILTMRGELKGESTYVEIECDIESSDESDGGAHYGIVVQDNTDDKYYSFCCNDWELGTMTCDPDLTESFELTEVKQVTKTIITYE